MNKNDYLKKGRKLIVAKNLTLGIGILATLLSITFSFLIASQIQFLLVLFADFVSTFLVYEFINGRLLKLDYKFQQQYGEMIELSIAKLDQQLEKEEFLKIQKQILKEETKSKNIVEQKIVSTTITTYDKVHKLQKIKKK